MHASWLHVLLAALPLTRLSLAAPSAEQQTYDYIVVGSGAGGGPLASRLARAGFATLLIEAGTDQGESPYYQIPAFSPAAVEDPEMSWKYFVNHWQDPVQAEKDPKYVYDLANGTQYVGLSPPAGASAKGVLYPRAGTLGGCTAMNLLAWVSTYSCTKPSRRSTLTRRSAGPE